jgi:hypothetical protein
MLSKLDYLEAMRRLKNKNVMKTSRYFCLSLFSILLSFVGANRKPHLAQTDAPIQTDKQEYQVTYEPFSGLLSSGGKHGSPKYKPMAYKVTIKTSYTNRTGGDVYLPVCTEPRLPWLEKKVEGKWILAYDPGARMCQRTPVRIEPGETYLDTFDVEAFLPGRDTNLDFLVEEIEGTYRLVRAFYRINKGDPPWKTSDLPLEERVSNEFRLVRQP